MAFLSKNYNIFIYQHTKSISRLMKIKVLNVRLPDEVIAWLDILVEQGLYNSRAEAIRDFLREYVGNENK